MAKKQDSYYFDSFIRCVDCACEASTILHDVFQNFDPANIKERLDEIHAHEHKADSYKHEMLGVLVKAFITPIEREDIMSLAFHIDELVDRIDDVLQRVYCNNITVIRPDALKLTELIVRGCNEVKALMGEFENFKRSKELRTHIININSLEEEGDRLFIGCLRELHTTSTDPMEVFSWHELYTYLEKCLDACEHVADVVESTILKNS